MTLIFSIDGRLYVITSVPDGWELQIEGVRGIFFSECLPSLLRLLDMEKDDVSEVAKRSMDAWLN